MTEAEEKKKHMSKNNKAELRLNSLRPLIKTSAASDHQTRHAYLQQMPPAIHFSLISSINAHHIISYIIWLISPPYTVRAGEDQNRQYLCVAFLNAFYVLLLKGAN